MTLTTGRLRRAPYSTSPASRLECRALPRPPLAADALLQVCWLQVWRASKDQIKLWKRSRVSALFMDETDIQGILEMVKDNFGLQEVRERPS